MGLQTTTNYRTNMKNKNFIHSTSSLTVHQIVPISKYDVRFPFLTSDVRYQKQNNFVNVVVSPSVNVVFSNANIDRNERKTVLCYR